MSPKNNEAAKKGEDKITWTGSQKTIQQVQEVGSPVFHRTGFENFHNIARRVPGCTNVGTVSMECTNRVGFGVMISQVGDARKEQEAVPKGLSPISGKQEESFWIVAPTQGLLEEVLISLHLAEGFTTTVVGCSR